CASPASRSARLRRSARLFWTASPQSIFRACPNTSPNRGRIPAQPYPLIGRAKWRRRSVHQAIIAEDRLPETPVELGPAVTLIGGGVLQLVLVDVDDIAAPTGVVVERVPWQRVVAFAHAEEAAEA